MLTFTTAWRLLPEELRAHLIRHPALPGPGERPAVEWGPELLPSFDGPPRDLPLRRVAPSEFRMTG